MSNDREPTAWVIEWFYTSRTHDPENAGKRAGRELLWHNPGAAAAEAYVEQLRKMPWIGNIVKTALYTDPGVTLEN